MSDTLLPRRAALAALAGGLSLCALPLRAAEAGQLFVLVERRDDALRLLLRLTVNHGGLLATSQRILTDDVPLEGGVAEAALSLPGGTVEVRAEVLEKRLEEAPEEALSIQLQLRPAGAPPLTQDWRLPASEGEHALAVADGG
jgi:hypothetical protein